MRYLKSYSLFESFLSAVSKSQSRMLQSAFSLDDQEARTNFESIKKVLERDCKNFVDEMLRSESDLILRGTHYDVIKEEDHMFKLNVRKDRKPRDTDIVIHDLMDFYFEKKFNVRLRSQGVFTTKSYMAATEYGIPHIFFPIGDYDYYWNDSVDDVYTLFETDIASFYQARHENFLLDIFPDEWRKFDDPENTPDEEDEWFDQMSQRAIDEFEDFVSDIVDGYEANDQTSMSRIKYQEVIFVCDQYYLIPPEYFNFFFEWFDITPVYEDRF